MCAFIYFKSDFLVITLLWTLILTVKEKEKIQFALIKNHLDFCNRTTAFDVHNRVQTLHFTEKYFYVMRFHLKILKNLY